MYLYRNSNLPSPEALSPDIEEGGVNRRPLQALFLLLWGGAPPATGPGAILRQNLRTALQGWSLGKLKPSAVAIGRPIGHISMTKRRQDSAVERSPFSPFMEFPHCSAGKNYLQITIVLG